MLEAEIRLGAAHVIRNTRQLESAAEDTVVVLRSVSRQLGSLVDGPVGEFILLFGRARQRELSDCPLRTDRRRHGQGLVGQVFDQLELGKSVFDFEDLPAQIFVRVNGRVGPLRLDLACSIRACRSKFVHCGFLHRNDE